MSHTSAEMSSKESSRKTLARQQGTKSITRESAAYGKGGNGRDREEMIAVAAYFRAEHRGFDGGDPVVDWLAAESEVDAMLDNLQEVALH